MRLLHLIKIFELIAILSFSKVDFKIFEIDSLVNDIVFCGSNNEIMFVLTEKNSVYQSSNKGFTWKKLNDMLSNNGIKQFEKSNIEVWILIYISQEK